jgi:sigma-B regulation protein RsbU (phosphoserine phosphatase)
LWCVADVSGKGISAALIMANFQASLRALVSIDISLTELIKRLNLNVFKNTNGDRFITLFIGVYNEKTRKLKYINAGHNASIVLQNNKAFTLKEGSMMIGAFDELPFVKEGEIMIEKEAIIFNYTDGIIEFDGEEDQSIEEEELIEFLLANSHKEVKDIHELLLNKMETLRNFEEATDDITILSLKIH